MPPAAPAFQAAQFAPPPEDGRRGGGVAQVFDAVDRNHDGAISSQEFKRYRDAMNTERTDPTDGHLFKALDRNQDGVMSLAEFKHFRDVADLNRDGTVNQSEFLHYEQVVAPILAPQQRGSPSHAANGVPTPPRSPGGAWATRGFDDPSALQQEPAEGDILEFLEGLLEGFRAAAGMQPQGGANDWSDLDALGKSSPATGSRQAAHGGGTPHADSDPVSTLMRRHALRAFLEETCETIANAFDVMAGLALRGSLGGSGTQQDRLRHMFTEEELRRTLGSLGYGVGAAPTWWRALFQSLDVDNDGAVSLQDMYDALVLYLPPMPDAGGKPEVFFAAPPEETWKRKQTIYAAHPHANR